MGSVIIGIGCIGAAAMFGLNAFMASSNAETIMHQMYGTLNWIVSSILGVGGVLLCHFGWDGAKASLGEPPKKEVAPKVDSTLEQIAADLAWFKEIKSKEIVRARAAEQARKQQS